MVIEFRETLLTISRIGRYRIKSRVVVLQRLKITRRIRKFGNGMKPYNTLFLKDKIISSFFKFSFAPRPESYQSARR